MTNRDTGPEAPSCPDPEEAQAELIRGMTEMAQRYTAAMDKAAEDKAELLEALVVMENAARDPIDAGLLNHARTIARAAIAKARS